MQSVVLPTTLISLFVTSCRDLQRVAGVGDLPNLAELIIKRCPELEELPSLAGLSCLEEIEIDSLVIGCYVVVVKIGTLVENTNRLLGYYSIQVREGQWILTLAARDYRSFLDLLRIEYVLRHHRIMKAAFRVERKEGQEWKAVDALCTIIDRLYHL
ncbi:hypothetical protein SUGI_0670860 [Cryptomeria japonica]|nr:hypothetical protein SUGI_0670860 [Cryptomeria japonica]